MTDREKCICAIDAIEDAIEQRRLSGHAHDKGLGWAKSLLNKLLRQLTATLPF